MLFAPIVFTFKVSMFTESVTRMFNTAAQNAVACNLGINSYFM